MATFGVKRAFAEKISSSTSGTEKVMGHKGFYTKNGHFRAHFLAPILELKIV
jgi:hypothetical protein